MITHVFCYYLWTRHGASLHIYVHTIYVHTLYQKRIMWLSSGMPTKMAMIEEMRPIRRRLM